MKKFVLKKAIFTLRDHYTMYDDTKPILSINLKNIITTRKGTFTIVDNDGQTYAQIQKEVVLGERVNFHLYNGEEKILTIHTNIGMRTKGFWIDEEDIYTTHNKAKTLYHVYRGEQLIGKIEMRLFKVRESYTIYVEDTSLQNIFMFISFVVAIHDRDPSIVGTVFRQAWR